MLPFAGMQADGVIGVAGGEFARYAITYHSILGLCPPPKTAIIPVRGASIAENRNNIAREALDAGAQWVFYIDDDNVIPQGAIQTLLAHGKPITSGLYTQRSAPFIPHVYDVEDENGWAQYRVLELGDAGLKQVLATGAGCMLVRREVFEGMSATGNAGSGEEWWQLGELKRDGWCDDIGFCRRARAAGFTVWADLELSVGHQMNGTLYPQREKDGTWRTVLVQYPSVGAIASWPAASREPYPTITP